MRACSCKPTSSLESRRESLQICATEPLVRYNAACTYALLGEAERSIDLLEAYLPLVSKDQQMWFLNDSDLDPIRSHPRYAGLLALMK